MAPPSAATRPWAEPTSLSLSFLICQPETVTVPPSQGRGEEEVKGRPAGPEHLPGREGLPDSSVVTTLSPHLLLVFVTKNIH